MIEKTNAIQGAHILMVDDNAMCLDAGQRLLEAAGATVSLARNGSEAMAMLFDRAYDCVLMDVQMPVLNGLEAVRQIRSEPAIAGVRVIGMTADHLSHSRQQCLSAGMDDFLEKPIDARALFAALGKWLPRE